MLISQYQHCHAVEITAHLNDSSVRAYIPQMVFFLVDLRRHNQRNLVSGEAKIIILGRLYPIFDFVDQIP